MPKSKQASDQTAQKGAYHHGDLRAALLQAAEAELNDKNIESLSLRGVAKRAGVSHAAPAHHFGDKSGLLTALAIIGFQRLTEAQTSRSKLTGTEDEAFVAKGHGYVAFATANPALFDLMFGSQQPDYADADLLHAANQAIAPLVESIAHRASGSPFGGGDPTHKLVAAWALVHGFAGLINHGKLRWVDDLEGGSEALVNAVLTNELSKR
ncbi:MAG: WHG domain-containing protein [Pseudomonadota bacterium]